MIRRFEVFRPNAAADYRDQGAANAPDEVQFEGVVFSDGTVAVRWLTEFRSHSVWASLADLERIHGHPEYGTEWRWLDEPASISGDAAPVLVTWDPGEATTTHIGEIADAVRIQSGGRVIITMTDIADSDCHAVIGSRPFTDDEALALLDAEAGDPQ